MLARLTDRRIAVEKELSALGEAKKGANDIFRHCRGFERAYSIMLQVGAAAGAGGAGGCGSRRSPASALLATCIWLLLPLRGQCCFELLNAPHSPTFPPYPPLLQEANTAFKIRAVVEGTLPDSLHKIPIEKRFTKDYVRNVSRQPEAVGLAARSLQRRGSCCVRRAAVTLVQCAFCSALSAAAF